MFEIETLLQPISPEQPVGRDLRAAQSADYHTLKEARAAARRQERETLYDENAVLDLSHWRQIAELAPRLLAEQSKDLQIAAWLTEAALRLHGFTGLKQCLVLLRSLMAQFWPDVYPEEDEEGLSTKFHPLTGLNGEHSEGALVAPIYSAPLLEISGTDVSAWHYQQALSYVKITDPQKLAQLEKSGAVTLEQIKAAAHGAPPSQLAERIAEIQACLEETTALTDWLQATCGAYEAPSLNYIQTALKTCLDAAQALHKMMAPAHTPEAKEETAPNQNLAAAQLDGGDAIHSKAQALHQLEQLAMYFKHNEPQSPVAYLLEKALYWSSLSLPELLSQLIPDDQSLHYSYQMLGVMMPEPQRDMESDLDHD